MTEGERERLLLLLERKRNEYAKVRKAMNTSDRLDVGTKIEKTRIVLEKFKGEITKDSVPYEVLIEENGELVYRGPAPGPKGGK